MIAKRNLALLLVSSLFLFACSLGGDSGAEGEGGASRPATSAGRGSEGFAAAPGGFRPAGAVPARPPTSLSEDRPDQTSDRPHDGTPADRPHDSSSRPDDASGGSKSGDDDPRGDDGSDGGSDHGSDDGGGHD